MCVLCSDLILWVFRPCSEAGQGLWQWSIIRWQWPPALILISLALDEISLHLNPILSLKNNCLPASLPRTPSISPIQGKTSGPAGTKHLTLCTRSLFTVTLKNSLSLSCRWFKSLLFLLSYYALWIGHNHGIFLLMWIALTVLSVCIKINMNVPPSLPIPGKDIHSHTTDPKCHLQPFQNSNTPNRCHQVTSPDSTCSVSHLLFSISLSHTHTLQPVS